jgi:flagellar assembly protein FliH
MSHLAPAKHHARFAFDTQFDEAGDIASAPHREKRWYSPDELEAARGAAFREGERSVTARAEAHCAAALAEIADAVRHAMGGLAQAAHDHRGGAADLALACARKIADAALMQFPQGPITAALEVLAAEIEQEPRLRVRVAPGLKDRVQAALEKTAEQVGFPGKIITSDDPALPAAAFVIDWGDGRAAFDPIRTAERIEAEVAAALASEGLHAEVLTPPHEA